MPPKHTPQASKKRKRDTSAHEASPSVRKKGKSTSEPAESSPRGNSDEIWQVRAIIKERKVGRRIQYLIDWEPHSQTGQTYDPTWLFSKDVGDGSIQEWHEGKERQKQQRRRRVESVSGDSQGTDETPEPKSHFSATAKKLQRQGRKSRVIDSSPTAQSTTPRQGRLASPTVEGTPGASLTEPELSPLREPGSTFNPGDTEGLAIPQVHVTITSDFNRDEYQTGLSQVLPSSSPAPAVGGATLPAVPEFVEPQTVIPDSQAVTTVSSADTPVPKSVDPQTPREFAEEASEHNFTEALLGPTSIDDKAGHRRFNSSVAVFETDPIEVSSPNKLSPVPAKETGQPEIPKEGGSPSLQSENQQPDVEIVDFQEAQIRDIPYEYSNTSTVTQQNESFPSVDIASPVPSAIEADPLKTETSSTASASSLQISQQLHDQLQSTLPVPFISTSWEFPKVPSPAELSSSSAPQPPSIRFDTFPTQLSQAQSDMPETRRSLRGSGPSSGTSGSPARTAPSTPKQNKNLRSIRAEDNAKRKEREEKQQRETALKEEQQREKEAKEAEEAAAAFSTSTSQDSENPTSAIPAEDTPEEPLVPRDEEGNAQLPDRIPADDLDKTMNSASENEDDKAPAQSVQSSSESELDDESGPTLEQMEFIVPLPLTANARDIYRKTVKYNEVLVEKFTGRNWSQEASILTDAQNFVQKMRDVATHVDLTNETTSSQGPVEPGTSVNWDRSISTKFKFLYHLLNDLRGQSLHMVIVCRPGKIIDMLENFLIGTSVNYSRTDAPSDSPSSTASGSLTLTLLPASGTGSNAVLAPAHLLLTLDHFIDVKDPQVRALRQHPTHPEQLAPVVSLAVVNSVDHIERSLMPSLTGAQRLRVLVRCIAKLRKDAGKSEAGRPSIEESAMDVARFVAMRGSEDTWPLANIGQLDNNDAWDLSQGLVTMKSAGSSDSEKSAKAKAALKSAQKRRLDQIQGSESEATKKMRMTPQGDNDASTTRISDSMAGDSSQANKTPTNSDEITALRALLKATEDRLQATILAKDTENRELEKALADLQFRFEEQTVEKRVLVSDLTDAKLGISALHDQSQARNASIEFLKDENRTLKAQLVEAHAVLETSAIPEIAAMEKLRQEKDRAEEARSKAEREAASQNSLTKYLREQYADASTRAAELSQENEEFVARNKALEKTASGEISKVRQMHQSEQQKRTASENLRLKQENKNLTVLLQRKEEELRNRKAGIGTRAGSVPRSPRVGPTSRAGSPIPDRRIGVLKNNMNFQGQGLGRRTPKQPPPDDHTEATSTIKYSAPVIAEPKPRAKPVEIKMMESRQPEAKVPVSRPPEPIPPAPRPAENRTSGGSTRPFPCCFAQYNCGSAFTSKNEWKRHISTKHIQLGFWRCDMCPPSPGIDHPVYNDFNRKDLFTQHLRRMHAVPATLGTQDGKEASQPTSSTSTPNTPQISDEQITEIQKRCYRQLRLPPETSSCVFCTRNFSGPNSWEERLEHVGGHLERDRKNGSSCPDVSTWRIDPPLRNYLEVEGLVEVDPRGGFRIGDGKPRRPVEIEGYAGQQPTTQLTPRANPPTSEHAAAAPTNDGDSESSSGRRRRGRPPKRMSDAMEIDPPTFNPASSSQPEPLPSPLQHHHQQQQQHMQHNHHTQNHHQQNHHPHQLAPMQDMRDGGGNRSHPMNGPLPPQPIHMAAPANLQTMYEFRHGTFTKFQGTSAGIGPRPIQELPPPALSTRAHGQPQLAPKPSPDPRDGTAGLSPGNGPQLAPKPFHSGPPGSVSPMAPTHHSGFKPINENRAPLPLPSKGPVHVAPKSTPDHLDGVPRLQEGGRQLAPKPVQQQQQPICDEDVESGDRVVTKNQTTTRQRPTTPPQQQSQPSQEAMSGAEAEEARRQTRGKSFREVVMS